MQRKSIMYKGVTLTSYCKSNNLPISPIYSFIRRAKDNPKYNSMSDEEIVELAIENSLDDSLYNYRGISLKTYCEEHDYPFNIAMIQLKYLKNRYPTLNNKEITNLVVEYYIIPSLALSYKGVSLFEFCKDNNYSYSSLKEFIYDAAETNPFSKLEDIVKLYIEQEHKGRFKYYYKGVPLIEYCKQNNLSYTSIIAYIGRLKDNGDLDGLNDTQIIEKVMKSYKPVEKRMYKGKSLAKYCEDEDISYSFVLSLLKKKKEENPDISDNDLLTKIVDSIKNDSIKYYYKGLSLEKYCRENKLNISSVRKAIKDKINAGDNRPIEIIIDEVMKKYESVITKYCYNGIPLSYICEKLDIDFNKVLYRYKRDYQNSDIPMDEAFKTLLKVFIEKKIKKVQYTVDGMPLYDYCEKNELPYYTIINYIKVIKAEDETISDEEVTKEAIKKYKKQVYDDKANQIFIYLTANKIEDINKARELCDTLRIDFENVIDSNQEGLSYDKAILLIWYFADSRGRKNRPMVSGKTLEVVLGFASYLKTRPSLDKVKLFLLIRVHKCKLYDATNEILIKETKYINGIIDKYSNKYGITLDHIKSTELISNYIMKAIDNSFFNREDKLMEYIDQTVNTMFDSYINKYLIGNGPKTLEYKPKEEE